MSQDTALNLLHQMIQDSATTLWTHNMQTRSTSFDSIGAYLFPHNLQKEQKLQD
jgi:hypothetical protein